VKEIHLNELRSTYSMSYIDQEDLWQTLNRKIHIDSLSISSHISRYRVLANIE
jgi:hypothetical protein